MKYISSYRCVDKWIRKEALISQQHQYETWKSSNSHYEKLNSQQSVHIQECIGAVDKLN
jgi:hypothetical protein